MWAGWSYSGMVGRASVSRLLELALAEMQAEPAVLRGDINFYGELAERQSACSQEWTAYYSGRGQASNLCPDRQRGATSAAIRAFMLVFARCTHLRARGCLADCCGPDRKAATRSSSSRTSRGVPLGMDS